MSTPLVPARAVPASQRNEIVQKRQDLQNQKRALEQAAQSKSSGAGELVSVQNPRWNAVASASAEQSAAVNARAQDVRKQLDDSLAQMQAKQQASATVAAGASRPSSWAPLFNGANGNPSIPARKTHQMAVQGQQTIQASSNQAMQQLEAKVRQASQAASRAASSANRKAAKAAASSSTTTATGAAVTDTASMTTAMSQAMSAFSTAISQMTTQLAPVSGLVQGANSMANHIHNFSNDDRLMGGFSMGVPLSQQFDLQPYTWLKAASVDHAWMEADQTRLLFRSGRDPIGQSALSSSLASGLANTETTDTLDPTGATSTQLAATSSGASAAVVSNGFTQMLFQTIPVVFTHLRFDAARQRILVGGSRITPALSASTPTTAVAVLPNVSAALATATGTTSTATTTTTTTAATTNGTATTASTTMKKVANNWEPILLAFPMLQLEDNDTLWPGLSSNSTSASDDTVFAIAEQPNPNFLTPFSPASNTTTSASTSSATSNATPPTWDASNMLDQILAALPSTQAALLGDWEVLDDGSSFVLINLLGQKKLLASVLVARLTSRGDLDSSFTMTTVFDWLQNAALAASGLAMRYSTKTAMGLVSLAHPSPQTSSVLLVSVTGQVLQQVPLPAGTFVRSMLWSSDGQRAYLIGDQITDLGQRRFQTIVAAYSLSFDSVQKQTQLASILTFGTNGVATISTASSLTVPGATWMNLADAKATTTTTSTTPSVTVAPAWYLGVVTQQLDARGTDRSTLLFSILDPTTGTVQSTSIQRAGNRSPFTGLTLKSMSWLPEYRAIAMIGQRRRVVNMLDSGDIWISTGDIPSLRSFTTPIQLRPELTLPSANGDAGAIGSALALDPTLMILYGVGDMQTSTKTTYHREGILTATPLLF